MEKGNVNPIDPQGVYHKLNEVSDAGGHICFIFGAGASVGYTRDKARLVPPIVADLFKDDNQAVQITIKKHASIERRRVDIEDELSEHNGDLEDYLETLYKKDEDNELFSNLMFYLQDVCYLASKDVDDSRATNNYLRLIYRMQKKGGKNWSCITFNYDTILEKTFMLAGSQSRAFSEPKHYSEDPKIIKIHGSINFRYRIQDINQVGDQFSNRTQMDVFKLMMNRSVNSQVGYMETLPSLSDPIPPFHLPPTVKTRPGFGGHFRYDEYNFPVMMVPIHHTEHVEKGFFAKTLGDAISEVEKSDLVVVIGYNFGDRMFTKELEKIDLSKKEIILIGATDFSDHPDTNLGFQRIVPFWKGNVFSFKGKEFSGFIDAIGPKPPPLTIGAKDEIKVDEEV